MLIPEKPHSMVRIHCIVPQTNLKMMQPGFWCTILVFAVLIISHVNAVIEVLFDLLLLSSCQLLKRFMIILVRVRLSGIPSMHCSCGLSRHGSSIWCWCKWVIRLSCSWCMCSMSVSSM